MANTLWSCLGKHWNYVFQKKKKKWKLDFQSDGTLAGGWGYWVWKQYGTSLACSVDNITHLKPDSTDIDVEDLIWSGRVVYRRFGHCLLGQRHPTHCSSPRKRQPCCYTSCHFCISPVLWKGRANGCKVILSTKPSLIYFCGLIGSKGGGGWTFCGGRILGREGGRSWMAVMCQAKKKQCIWHGCDPFLLLSCGCSSSGWG